MKQLLDLFDQHGPLLVFLNVFIEQLGVPVPAVPTMVLAGALAAQGRFDGWSVLILAVLASGIANFMWFMAGRRFGTRVLGLMCRISLSPDACVRRTENVFARWGLVSLLVARFVPGLSAVASPLAGSMGLPAYRFVLFDALGTSLWAGASISGGLLFHRQIEAVLGALGQIGAIALPVLVGLLALYIAWRWVERRRLLSFSRAHRIEADELQAMVESGNAPVIVDVRSMVAREGDPRRIPGALEAELEQVESLLAHLPPEREIVFYCNCPNEASAALATRRIKRHGFKRVRALSGGLDAWYRRAGAGA